MPAKRGPAAKQAPTVYGMLSITPESFGLKYDNCLDMCNEIARDLGIMRGQLCAFADDDETKQSTNIFMVFRTRWRHHERDWFSMDTSLDYDARTSEVIRDTDTHPSVLGLKIASIPNRQAAAMIPSTARTTIHMRTSWVTVKRFVSELIYALLHHLAVEFKGRTEEDRDSQAFAVSGDDRWIPEDLRTLVHRAELVT